MLGIVRPASYAALEQWLVHRPFKPTTGVRLPYAAIQPGETGNFPDDTGSMDMRSEWDCLCCGTHCTSKWCSGCDKGKDTTNRLEKLIDKRIAAALERLADKCKGDATRPPQIKRSEVLVFPDRTDLSWRTREAIAKENSKRYYTIGIAVYEVTGVASSLCVCTVDELLDDEEQS